MEAAADFDSFVAAGLASMGIEVDEIELAVAAAAHRLWWPALVGLLEADLGVEPEVDPDMSRAPEQ